jgi:hypothetical protein
MELSMRTSPPIVPNAVDRGIYIVLEDYGPLGRAWRVTNEAGSDRETLIGDMLDGQYDEPVRVVAFNTSETWSRDVTEDIANELREICAERGEIPGSIADFIQEHASRRFGRQLRFQL